MERGVRLPFREAAGVVAGIKAGWDVLTRPSAPSAKTEVKRAAQHVDDLESQISRDAARASHVNDPIGQYTAGQTADDRGSAAAAGRSVVEAGEEIVAPPSEGLAGGHTTAVPGEETSFR